MTDETEPLHPTPAELARINLDALEQLRDPAPEVYKCERERARAINLAAREVSRYQAMVEAYSQQNVPTDYMERVQKGAQFGLLQSARAVAQRALDNLLANESARVIEMAAYWGA